MASAVFCKICFLCKFFGNTVFIFVYSFSDRKLVNSADGSSGDVRKSRRNNERRRATRRHYDDISLEEVAVTTMETPTASERRMAKYKEERRRQLASQIASRLSNACR